MIRSMTAFARGTRETHGGILTWELRSVNHRFLDIALHLPEELRGLELTVRERLGAMLKRGKLEACLRLQSVSAVNGSVSELPINQTLLNQLLHAAEQVNKLIKAPAPVNALDMLRWPGVLESRQIDTERMGSDALTLLDEVLNELMAVRAREGSKITVLLEQRCHAMENVVGKVRAHMPRVLEHCRTKLRERCAELKAELDAGRLEQEMLLLMHKSDVDEELERLAMHIKEVCRVKLGLKFSAAFAQLGATLR